MLSVDGKPCGKPAAFAQKLAAGRQFVYCEEHAPALVKKTVEREEARAKK